MNQGMHRIAIPHLHFIFAFIGSFVLGKKMPELPTKRLFRVAG
jgi:hypothetical protein